jgi:hypothetical protein
VLWVFDCYMRSEEGVGFGYFECLIAEFVFSTVLYLRRCTLTLRHQHTFCPGCSLCVTIPRTCAISAVRDSQRLLHKLSQLLDLQKVTPRVLKCGDWIKGPKHLTTYPTLSAAVTKVSLSTLTL